MKYYCIPEILFSILAVAFLWSLPTYNFIKIVFILIYFIFLFRTTIENWQRAKAVQKIKEEKHRYAEEEMNRIRNKQEELARQQQEKELLKAKEQEQFQKKIQKQKQIDEAKAQREMMERTKNSVRSEIGPYLQGYITKNFKVLTDPNYLALTDLIKRKNLDTRMLFAPGLGEEKLEGMIGELKGKTTISLIELVTMAKGYQESLKIFINFLKDKGFNLREQLLEIIIDDEIDNKKYQNFKSKIYNEKRGLKYTTEISDYISSFVDLYGHQALNNINYFVRVLVEDIDRNLSLDLIRPLVEQEVRKKTG